MNAGHWNISDLPWDQFDRAKLDPEILKVIKAASLVEFGGDLYARYLCDVFHDDPAFQQAARDWAVEEIRHGEVLGRYASQADPTFDLTEAFARYRKGYDFQPQAGKSVRGSRSGELIARCIVETGTSSHYTSLADASEEPLLKAICRRIAADELRHYKLFHGWLKRYLAREGLSRFDRLRIGLGRVRESEDDELAYAYYVANAPAGSAYHRETYATAYKERAYRFYRPEHMDRVVAMVFKACGLRPYTVWHGLARRAMWWFLARKIPGGRAVA